MSDEDKISIQTLQLIERTMEVGVKNAVSGINVNIENMDEKIKQLFTFYNEGKDKKFLSEKEMDDKIDELKTRIDKFETQLKTVKRVFGSIAAFVIFLIAVFGFLEKYISVPAPVKVQSEQPKE